MKRLVSKSVTKKLLAGVLALGSVVAVSACSPEEDIDAVAPTTDDPAAVDGTDSAEEPMASDMETDASANGSIVEVASNAGSFNTLTQAIEAAGLTETLSQEGSSYTVFAPTDEAFNQLPEGTLDQLLLPENQELLSQILTYHVVPQAVTAEELQSGEVSTVEGSPVNVEVGPDGNVMVNDAMVTQPDIQASNGVIHVIDQVILQPQAAAQLTGAEATNEG